MLKAYWESVCRDMHQEVDRDVYWEVDRQVYQVNYNSIEAANRLDGHRSGLRKIINVSRSMTSLYRVLVTTSCKIYSTEHVEVLHSAQTVLAHLNLVSITIFRDAHLLDVDESDKTTHYAIRVYDWRLWLLPAPEGAIDAESRAEAVSLWRCRQ